MRCGARVVEKKARNQSILVCFIPDDPLSLLQDEIFFVRPRGHACVFPQDFSQSFDSHVIVRRVVFWTNFNPPAITSMLPLFRTIILPPFILNESIKLDLKELRRYPVTFDTFAFEKKKNVVN